MNRAETGKREKMSLDFYLEEMRPSTVFTRNITHNLGRMAEEAGIYACLWRSAENGFVKASDVAPALSAGLDLLRSDPERFRKFDASNGWGTYENFLEFCEAVLRACHENPEATVRAWV